MSVRLCVEHPKTPILEDAGGREYCPTCVNANVTPSEVYPLLVRLTNAARAFRNRDQSSFLEFALALDEAEEFLELHG